MVDSDLGNEWEGERNFKEFFFWGGEITGGNQKSQKDFIGGLKNIDGQ